MLATGRRAAGLALTPMIEAQTAEAWREMRDLRIPHALIPEQTVREHDGLPAATQLVVQIDLIDAQRGHRRWAPAAGEAL